MLVGVLLLGFTTQISAQEVVDNGEITVINSKKPSINTDQVQHKNAYVDGVSFRNVEEPGVVVKNNSSILTTDEKQLHRRYEEVSAVLNN